MIKSLFMLYYNQDIICSISSLHFSFDGSLLAIANSHTFERDVVEG